MSSQQSDNKKMHQKILEKTSIFNLRTAIMELFDIGPLFAITVLTAIAVIFIAGIVFFIRSAPPSKITFIAGPEGSSFYKTALKYQKALEKNGVKVKIIESEGSMENMDKVAVKEMHIDLGLIQSGILDDSETVPDSLISLGAIGNQPVFFFYRGKPVEHLYELKGRTIAIGSEGTGTHKIAEKLLGLNGIKEKEDADKTPASEKKDPETQLVHLDADEAVRALHDKKIDGAFIMTENIKIDELKKLLHADDVHLMDFKHNAAAYVRKVDFLNTLTLPEGAIDFERNIPETDMTLVGPRVELIANKRLHPALSDLILDAAMTIHSKPGMWQKRGEFPALIEQDVHVSDDAERFYKSGKTLFYRYLPFWLASLVNRVVVVIIPMIVVLIPIMRLIPWTLRWRNTMRLRRLYRALMKIEHDFKFETNPEKVAVLHKNFSRIDGLTRNMRVRPAFADQFYNLRGHIDYVRRTMEHETRS